ncbi:gas vesicle protein [Xylanimonas sp. McL0601]|uniref:gas vesicle protein n=1 Tax=Xylanimonas sp. McL0601 TaxID=3414739 RepID=UPI003CED3FBA
MSETGTLTAPGRSGSRVLQPTRSTRATLPDLLEVLLNKGVYLDLDLIVTVADIPLIGVNLRATIAGIETMLEYGMMRRWDAQTREWVRRSLARRVPLDEDEDVVARMAGGYRQEEPFVTWRPGTVYLTSRRLLVWRSEPRELVWQVALADIADVGLHEERSIGGEPRTRVAVRTPRGTALLSAAAPQRLRDLLLEPPGGSPDPAKPLPLAEGPLWYQEPRVRTPVWRGGIGAVDDAGGLTWRSTRDARAAVRLAPGDVVGVEIEAGHSPVGREVVVVTGAAGRFRLAATDTGRWVRLLRALQQVQHADDHRGGAA